VNLREASVETNFQFLFALMIVINKQTTTTQQQHRDHQP
jgi:hypothetical protein